MKAFPKSFVTNCILFGAFLVGYAYARLRTDEFARRKAYIRYTNFMLILDSYAPQLETWLAHCRDSLKSFDHSEYLWKLRT